MEEHQGFKASPGGSLGKVEVVQSLARARPSPAAHSSQNFRRVSDGESNQRQVGESPNCAGHHQIHSVRNCSAPAGQGSPKTQLRPKDQAGLGSPRGQERQAGSALPKCLSGAFLGSRRKLPKLALVLGKKEGSFWDQLPSTAEISILCRQPQLHCRRKAARIGWQVARGCMGWCRGEHGQQQERTHQRR